MYYLRTTGIDAVAREARAALGRGVGSPEVRRDNLDVFDLSFTAGMLVLDPDVRKMAVPIDDGQIVASRRLRDLAIERICSAFSSATFAIQAAKESLAVPLES